MTMSATSVLCKIKSYHFTVLSSLMAIACDLEEMSNSAKLTV